MSSYVNNSASSLLKAYLAGLPRGQSRMPKGHRVPDVYDTCDIIVCQTMFNGTAIV